MNLARVSAILVVIFIVVSVLIIVAPITNALPEATDHAVSIDFLFKFMLVASTAVFLIVQGFLLYFALRYRHRKGEPADALGADIHGNTRLEIVWSVIPAIFLVVLTGLSIQVYTDIIAIHKDAYQINVTASQFQWECDHPAYHIQEFSQCHMPLGQVQLNLHATDVIHSFWVPDFRVKQDAVPGYPTFMHFKTTRVGQYRLLCSEFCGVGHSEMYAKVFVMTQADFKKWALAQQKASSGTGSLANLSFSKDIEPIFTAHCSACHIAANPPFGGLYLGSYAGLQKGGNVVPGPVITPKDHLHSIVWEITKAAPPYPAGNRMPLGGPYLDQHTVDTIAAWIDQGAKNN